MVEVAAAAVEVAAALVETVAKLGAALAMAVAAVVAAGAITTSSFVLVDQRSHHEVAMKEVDVLGFVRSFMTGFTSLDPFHANDYVEQILAHATGDFAKQYRDKQNEILIQIAQAEPTKGTALAAGVERWNDDGSANVWWLPASRSNPRTESKRSITQIVGW